MRLRSCVMGGSVFCVTQVMTGCADGSEGSWDRHPVSPPDDAIGRTDVALSPGVQKWLGERQEARQCRTSSSFGPNLFYADGVTADGTIENFAEIDALNPTVLGSIGSAYTTADLAAIEATVIAEENDIAAAVPAATIQAAMATPNQAGDPCWKPYSLCNSRCRGLFNARARGACFAACTTAYGVCRAAYWLRRR